MTIEELYKYAVKHNIEDYDIWFNFLIEQLYNWATKNGARFYDIAVYGDAGGQYNIDSGDLEIDDTNEEVIIG